MKGKAITVALVLGLVSAAAPIASAYHITASAPSVILCAGVAETSGDWCLGAGNLIVCESEGAFDDRNANPAGPKHGDGGLCATGNNFATNAAFGYGIPPPPGTIIRLDTCDLTVTARGGPMGAGGAACADRLLPGADGIDGTADDVAGGADNTDGIKWTFQTTAFACTVWTQGQTRPLQYSLTSPALTVDDAAIYYEALYAWWDYESGDGSYTAPFAMDGSVLDNDPDAASAGFPVTLDSVHSHHGHVGMFIVNNNPVPVANVGSVAYLEIPGGWPVALAISTARAGTFGWAASAVPPFPGGASGTWKDGQPFVDGSPDPLTLGGQSFYNNCGPSSSGGLTPGLDAIIGNGNDFATNPIVGPAVRAV